MRESDVYIDGVGIRGLNLYLLKDHEHPLITGTRDRIITIPGLPGAYDYGADLEPISFNLPIGFIRKGREDIQRTVRIIKDLLIDGQGKPKTFKLTFGYEPDKYYNVRFTGSIPIERLLGRIGQFELPLICFDGHAWSSTRSDEVAWGSEVITFESDVYNFGHSGDGAKTFIIPGSTNITVSGANVQPIIYLIGTGTNVTLSCGGRTFSLGSFVNADWLIDLSEYVVLKNGVNAIHLISGNWIGLELIQGDNQIDINGSGLNLDFSVEFQDRYF